MNEKKGRFSGIKKNHARFHKSKICNSRGVFAKSRKKNKLGKYRLDQTLVFFSSDIITYDNSAGPFSDCNSIISPGPFAFCNSIIRWPIICGQSIPCAPTQAGDASDPTSIGDEWKSYRYYFPVNILALPSLGMYENQPGIFSLSTFFILSLHYPMGFYHRGISLSSEKKKIYWHGFCGTAFYLFCGTGFPAYILLVKALYFWQLPYGKCESVPCQSM